MKIRKEVATIFAIQVTEVLGFSLILPFLPFYAQELGASALEVGLILSVFSVFQFFSAPVLGRLSDHYGRRPLLILSQISTFVGFVLLGLANNLWMIYLARIIDGLLGSNFTIAQAYLSDISTKKDRSKMFGLSGAAFGVGFLIGPAIGGFLSHYSYSLPAFIAAGISLVTVLTTWWFLPETIKGRGQTKKEIRVLELEPFAKYFQDPRVAIPLWQFFLFLATHTLWVSSLALFAERKLGFGAAQVGYLLTFIGLVSIFLRGLALSRLIDWWGEERLKLVGLGLIVLSLGLTAGVTEARWFLLIMGMFAVGTGVARPLLQGEISRRVSESEQGAILGVTGSLGSLSQIVAPLIGGWIIQYYLPEHLSWLAAGLMSIALLLVLANHKGSVD